MLFSLFVSDLSITSYLHSWLLDSLLTVSLAVLLVGVPLGVIGDVSHIIFYYLKSGCYSGHHGYYFIHSIGFLIIVVHYFLTFTFVLTHVNLVPFFEATWTSRARVRAGYRS